jgi:hypothetical protein
VQQALCADADIQVPSARPSAPSRSTKYVVAGLAAATAGVLAINPVTPTPTPLAAEVQHYAIELNAAVNPLVTLQETLTKTLTNLNLLGTGIPAASTSLLEGLANPAIYAEFAELITANATNPLPLISVLQNFPIDRVTTALQSSSNILTTNLQNLPTILQNTLGYLQTGQFVEAFSEVNVYFLVSILERPGGPLFPLFTIPGDIAAAIPGGGVLANVLDAVFTRGVIATGLTRALLVAPITATLFIAETLDHVQASFKAGDAAGALSELISAPIGFVDAFLNGYVPDFPTRSPFQGLLSPNGFFDYFLVDVPNAIATALKLPPQTPPVVAPVTARVAESAPTDLGLSASTTLVTADAPEAETPAQDAVTPVSASEPTDPVAEPSSSTGAGTTVVATDDDAEDDAAESTETSGSTTTAGSASQSSSSSKDKDDDDSDSASTSGGSTTGGSTTGGSTSSGSASSGSASSGSASSGSASSGSASSGSASSGGSDSGSKSGDSGGSGGGE